MKNGAYVLNPLSAESGQAHTDVRGAARSSGAPSYARF